ncbi:MAG: uncharacterized protein JWM27_1327 [Gemmatimonadetes bacterium]|nr:uncharacterized protein [Gemmatimonadota bacterium]
MNSSKSLYHGVANLTPGMLAAYARGTGWVQVTTRRKEVLVFRRRGRGADEVAIPNDPIFSDYHDRMLDAAMGLAAKAGVELSDLLMLLSAPEADILRSSVRDPLTASGMIPLSRGQGLYAAMRKALLSSACAVVDPQPYFPRLSRTAADLFVESCSIGQTEFGSFVATLVCPHKQPAGDPEYVSVLDEGPGDFTRRVTTMLMLSAAKIVNNIRTHDERRIVESADSDVVISGNICEALAELEPATEHGEVSLGMTWSPTRPLRQRVPSEVSFLKAYFPSIRDMASALRPTNRPEVSTFLGEVDSLYGLHDTNVGFRGEILISFQWRGTSQRARVWLSRDDYSAACDAHKANHRISVHGRFERSARHSYIHDADHFTVIKGLFDDDT